MQSSFKRMAQEGVTNNDDIGRTIESDEQIDKVLSELADMRGTYVFFRLVALVTPCLVWELFALSTLSRELFSPLAAGDVEAPGWVLGQQAGAAVVGALLTVASPLYVAFSTSLQEDVRGSFLGVEVLLRNLARARKVLAKLEEEL